MFIWVSLGLLFTLIASSYMIRYGFDKHLRMKIEVGSVIVTCCGAFAINMLQAAPAEIKVAEPSSPVQTRVQAKLTEDDLKQIRLAHLNEQRDTLISKGKVKWVKLKEKDYSLLSNMFFDYSKEKKTAKYSGEFLNKSDKFIVGIEYVLTMHNCGHSAGNRKNCPIEGDAIKTRSTEYLILPQGKSYINATVKLRDIPEHYVLHIDYTKVAYYDGPLPKDYAAPLTAENDRYPNIPDSMVDTSVTCGGGGKRRPSGGNVRADLTDPNPVRTC